MRIFTRSQTVGLAAGFLAALGTSPVAVAEPPLSPGASAPAALAATPLLLPGGPGLVRMDYLAYDATNKRVWVPAGNTGRVDVIEVGTGKLTPIEGFATLEQDSPRGKRIVGPSSATVGVGVVYVGNRAGNEVCAVDSKTLKRGGCVALPSMPDGLAYLSTTKEVWITTPRDHSLTFLDVSQSSTPILKGKLPVEGKPEGYAVDVERGLFYTNLEDKDQTLAIDVKTRKIVASYKPGCGQAEPQGLAIDPKRQLLFVACSDHAVALATNQNGAIRGQLPTGDGVDVIAYDATRGLLYAPSGKDAKLSVIKVGPQGELSLVATVPTAAGAKAVLVDGAGTAYVADSAGGRLLLVKPAK